MPEGVDGGAEAGGEFVGLADGHALGWDGLADGEGERAGIEVAGVNGKQVVDTAEGDGDERNLSADGEEGRSGEKGLEFAGGGAAAFGEDEEGHAGAKSASGATEAGKGRVRVDGVDGELAGTIEMPADEGDRPELFFGENAELEGEGGEDDGGVHIGRVVGGVDGDGMLVKVFDSVDGEATARDEEAAAGPCLSDAVLGSAGLFEQRDEKREGTAEAGPAKEERRLEDVGAPAMEAREGIGRARHWAITVARSSAARARRRGRTSPTR